MAGVVLAVVAVGVYLLVPSHAATPYASVSADSGTLSSSAQVVTDSTASDGKAVQFGSVSSGGGGGSGGSVWQPAQDTDWQWEIGTPLSTSNALQMGTGVTAYNGDTAPGDNPAIIDTDGILNPASTVSSLHSMGIKAICYIEVGTAGSYYTASDEGIATTYYDQLKAAGDLGAALSGYPQENFVNITAASAVTIEEAQIKQQCVDKGFDGVETDLDETWGNEEGTTGFGTFTQAQEESYLTTLANYMHANNIAWIAKNLDDEGSATFVSDMEPIAQGMISEECNHNSSCSLLSSFLADHKWIGNAEYTQDGETTANFCASDNSLNINGVLFDVNLDGTIARQPCR